MRKPEIGMALEAQKIFPEIDFEKSVMAGDSESDMLFGRNAGMKTVLINQNKEDSERLSLLYDFAYPDLMSFAYDL